jgi:hypothetical protein
MPISCIALEEHARAFVVGLPRGSEHHLSLLLHMIHQGLVGAVNAVVGTLGLRRRIESEGYGDEPGGEEHACSPALLLGAA